MCHVPPTHSGVLSAGSGHTSTHITEARRKMIKISTEATATNLTNLGVPCSSANIGPGFDVIGLALSIFLELEVTITPTEASSKHPLNCEVSYEGVNEEEVPLDARENLITRTALYVLQCHDKRSFPNATKVHIKNPIPLGRGLGSSGAAVVAGVALGNEVGNLGLSRARMLDFALMIERHPDNVAAALYGGFVGSYLNDLDPIAAARREVPLSEVLPSPAGGEDTGLTPPLPPLDIVGHCKKFRWSPEIFAITIIPTFEVSTATARSVLPDTYSKKDVVFNMQRIALLTSALGESPPDPSLIYQAMQDRVHQPYRSGLIPALPGILTSMSPKTHPGLLGVCLSGAGPTILALATSNFEEIAGEIVNRFDEAGVKCDWQVLTPAEGGLEIFRS